MTRFTQGGRAEQDASATNSQSCDATGRRTMFGMCLNWRVLGALAVVAGVVGVVDPRLLGRILPLLLVAACPLGMFAMMWAMRGTKGAPANPTGMSQRGSLPVGPETGGQSAPGLAELRAQLAQINGQQERLAAKIAELEPGGSAKPEPGGAVYEPGREPRELSAGDRN